MSKGAVATQEPNGRAELALWPADEPADTGLDAIGAAHQAGYRVHGVTTLSTESDGREVLQEVQGPSGRVYEVLIRLKDPTPSDQYPAPHVSAFGPYVSAFDRVRLGCGLGCDVPDLND